MTRVFWLEILSLFLLNHPDFSRSTTINCTLLQSKVPKPQLKYMLGGQVRVIWREKVNSHFNYKAHICHISLITSMNIANPYSCPQFQIMTSCTVKNDSDMNIHQCTMQVSQYFEYTVYLNANHQNCQLRGQQVKIRPSLRIACPDPVPKLDVYSESNGVIIAWTKAFRYVHLLYSLRCRKLGTFNRFHCCVRVHLPYRISPYYSEVCKTSQNKAITSSFECGSTYECRQAEVSTLNNFEGHLMPDDSSWPNSPPAMVLQVKKRKI